MYDLRPRKTRRPPPDPQTAIRRAAQQPRTGLTNANRGSLQQPRTVGNNVNRGTFSPSTIDNTEQVHIKNVAIIIVNFVMFLTLAVTS